MLIGLGYKKGVGKDVVASYLACYYGFRRLAFATKLKNAVREIYGFTEEQLNSPLLKETVDPRWKLSPRQALQIVGEALRNTNPWIWIQASNFAKLSVTNHIVISDVRHVNEITAIKDNGGVVWRVDRESAPSGDGHISENALNSYTDWDGVINNSGTVEETYAIVDKLMADYSAPSE